MACFLVPGTEAIAGTAIALIMRHSEKKKAELGAAKSSVADENEKQNKGFSHKLFWLADLLWGGVVLLAFEHLWHGEISPVFPFLTAARAGADAMSEVLHEMATVGVTMAAAVTAVWVVMVLVSNAIEKRGAAENGAILETAKDRADK